MFSDSSFIPNENEKKFYEGCLKFYVASVRCYIKSLMEDDENLEAWMFYQNEDIRGMLSEFLD